MLLQLLQLLRLRLLLLLLLQQLRLLRLRRLLLLLQLRLLRLRRLLRRRGSGRVGRVTGSARGLAWLVRAAALLGLSPAATVPGGQAWLGLELELGLRSDISSGLGLGLG